MNATIATLTILAKTEPNPFIAIGAIGLFFVLLSPMILFSIGKYAPIRDANDREPGDTPRKIALTVVMIVAITCIAAIFYGIFS